MNNTKIVFENAIRDLDNDLGRLDRDNPGKDARLAVFPDGFGAAIEPEGDRQLEVLPDLHARLAPFKNEPALATSLAKLAAAEQALRAAINAENAAGEAADTAFTEELTARTAVRAQLTSAHGRLRDLYKSRPAQAEVFFMKLGRREGRGKKNAPAPAAPPKNDEPGTPPVT